MSSNKNRLAIIKDNQIDVAAIIRIFKEEKNLIFRTVIITLIIGFIIAMFSMPEYRTSVKLLPESSSSMSLGNIGALASQFGISNFSMADGEDVSPELYSTIAYSLPFMKEIMNTEVYVQKKDSTMTLFQYLNKNTPFSFSKFFKKYTVKLPYTIINIFKKREGYSGEESDILYFSYDEWQVLTNLKKRMSFDINNKTGVVTINFRMPDPIVVTTVANVVKENLIEYIIDYRTEKISITLDFVETQLEDATKRFEKSQERLAEFRDQSHGELTQMARAKEQRLESEYDLAFKIYSAMAQKKDEVKLQLQENTPIVKELEPVYMPDEKSSPRRGMIMVMSLFLSLFIAAGIIFLKDMWLNVKDNI